MRPDSQYAGGVSCLRNLIIEAQANIMNRTYKLVWNAAQHMWVVAGELAKGRKKTSGKCLTLLLLLASGLGAPATYATPAVNALPTGESVASGSATFDRTVSNQLTVNQLSSRLITNWNSFDIGSNAQVIFAQPDAASVALNRVTGGSATEILGQLNANGQLIVVNPNGITFGAGSQVSAAAVVASSLDILDGDFNLGNLIFTRGATAGAVTNAGSIQGKHVVLLSPDINNSGSLSAVDGNVGLINADQANASTLSISQASTVAGVIKNTGTIQATQVNVGNGLVVLLGDTSQSSSHIDVSGTVNAAASSTFTGRNVNVVNDLAQVNSLNMTATNGININADVNITGNSNLSLTTGSAGYALNYGSKVNLAGAAPTFSVNGTPYSIISDVNQLQNMSLNLAGNFVLANDIDATGTISWNGGQGFVPVGTTSLAFSGNIEGLGHVVDGLSIQLPATDYVGLIGYTLGSSIRHLGITNANIADGNYTAGLVGAYGNGGAVPITLQANWVTGSVKGLSNVGGLVGQLSNSFLTSMLVNKNYVNAAVQGNTNVGGLLGSTQIFLITAPGSSPVTIGNNYVAGSVQGTTNTGGLIGQDVFNELIGNSSVYTIKDNLITAAVTGTTSPGGLIGNSLVSTIVFGSNSFKLNQNYVSGPVSGTAAGGLIGQASIPFGFIAPLNSNFWNTQTTGQSAGIGVQVGIPVSTGYTGINSTQAMQLVTFASWGADINATAGSGSTWRIYDGLSGPLLRSFLKPLTIGGDQSRTYDSTTISSPTLNYSRSNVDLSKILGTAIVSGTAIGARNVGSYSLNVSGGLYSTDQFGYDIGFASGTLNISAANLTISSTDVIKTYDATTSASGSAVVTAGSLFGSDSMSGGSFAFADKNAGTGKHVTVSGVMVNDGNGGNNYNISYADNTNSTINKRLLTLTAVVASKVYDGKLTSADKPLITGRQRGDSIVGLTQSYLNKNAGTGKTIQVDSGYTIRDGNNGNNYTVMLVDSHNGVITPKALTISTVANTKLYDGGVTSANKPLVTGLITGDRITGLFQQYETKTVGTGKKIMVKAGYVVNDGNSGNNYMVTEQGSMDGVINP